MYIFENKKASAKKIIAVIFAQILFCGDCFANVQPIERSQKSVRKMECKITPLEKSKTIIEFILSDISATYTQVGGGGITAVKQSHINTFVVSIAQEERVDQFTYEVAVDETCKVKILKKESSSIGYNR